MTDKEIREKLLGWQLQVRDLNSQATKLCSNRWGEITSNFNGQPLGRSRPSLFGKQFRIYEAYVDIYSVGLYWRDRHLTVLLEDMRFLNTESK